VTLDNYELFKLTIQNHLCC